MLLAHTSYYLTESATPGSGRGGLADGAGAPYRYGHTAVGWDSFSPWNDQVYSYSLGQINKGYNPLSNLEVVSLLNINNQALQMYAYSPANRTAKYYPKVYIGPSKTIGQLWIYEDKIDTSTTPPTTIQITEIPGWPENFEGPQKGEAKI